MRPRRDAGIAAPGAYPGAVDTTSAPTAGLTLLSRYVLEDRVGGDERSGVWRGTDTRLRRAVAVRLLAEDDPAAGAVRAQAQLAAAFTDRRAVPVLDVGLDGDVLVVVSEWVPALGYGDYLAARGSEPLTPREAAGVALEVARCLAAAHANGLAHGILHPNSILVTDSGEIRLRGLGIDDALASPDGDPRPFSTAAASDVHGVGALLYLGLTGRWPDGPVDHVPGADRLASGVLPWPSRVLADVPPALDEIAARSLQGCALPRGRQGFPDVASVAFALADVVDVRPAPAPTTTPAGPRSWVRVLGFVLALLGVGALAAFGIALASGPVTKTASPRTAPSASTGSGPSASTSVGSGRSGPLPIVAVRDLDPYGNDRRENRDLVPFATDGNPATAWTTVGYRTAELSGKPGVGLLLDLGAPRPMSSVRLVLLGNNTDLQVLVGDKRKGAPQGYNVFAKAQGAPTEVTLRSVRPVTARFVVIWLEKVPPSSSGFTGGVAEVSVLP